MTTKFYSNFCFAKALIGFCIFLLFPTLVQAQLENPYWECHFEESPASGETENLICATPGPDNSENGRLHTPKGTLRVLLVYAAFEGFENIPLGDWPIIEEDDGYTSDNHFGFPTYVVPTLQSDGTYSVATREVIFNQESDFSDPAVMGATSENNSISRVYNIASKPKEDFQIIGDVFRRSPEIDNAPQLVQIDPDDPALANVNNWFHLNDYVLEQLPNLNPDFPMENFDLRTNSPQWECDNSENPTPDGIVDYVIIIYRFSRGWDAEPIPGINCWGTSCSVGGFAGIGANVAWNQDLTIGTGGSGFTILTGGSNINNIMVHEFAHQIYSCPHFGGTNGVCGPYYNYHTTGWGATAYPGVFSPILNAWERWYLNFIDPVEVNSDATFELENFLTSQNPNKIAARIAIPFSNDQYLWIENHQRENTLDDFIWWGNGGNEIGPGNINIPNNDEGVYMYVEDITDDRSDVGLFNSGANGFKYMNARGRWDFEADLNIPTVQNNWGNNLYRFERNDENPIGGINTWGRARNDYDDNQSIGYTTHSNNGGPNEGERIMREFVNNNDEYTYASWGVNSTISNYSRTPAFQANDVLNMGSNPTILNYPTFNAQEENLNPYYLNGLEVKILSGGASASIQVKYKQTEIDEDVRWTGNIILPNITEDIAADLELAEGKEILLNRSKIASRLTPHPTLGGFANPTQFKIASGAKIHLKKNAILRVTEHSRLTIEDGAEVILEDGAQIIIEEKGHLIMEGNNILLNGNDARLVIKGTLATTEDVDFSFTGTGYVLGFLWKMNRLTLCYQLDAAVVEIS